MIAEDEQAIESQRQQLAKIMDFEPYACFTRIDRHNAGVVTSQDMVSYMHGNQKGEQLSQFECNYVIKFFDSTFQGFLTYQDFMQVILPCDNSVLRS